MNLDTKILASNSHLKRKWPLNNRLLAYKNAEQTLKNKKLNPEEYCFVIVQRFLHGQWTDQIYFVPKAHTLLSLYKRIVSDSKVAYFFYTPKTHTQVMMSKTFHQIHENLKDPDDNFIYLGLDEMNSFG